MSTSTPPGQTMTGRARAYVAGTAAQHAATGAFAAIAPGLFDGDGFAVHREVMPIWIWGLCFIAGAGYLARAAVSGVEDQARIGMVLSVGLTALMGAAFALSFLEGGVVSPVGTIFALALMYKDLVVCRQPLRSPFQRLVEEYAATHPDDAQPKRR